MTDGRYDDSSYDDSSLVDTLYDDELTLPLFAPA